MGKDGSKLITKITEKLDSNKEEKKMEMVKGKLNVFFVDTELQWEPHKKFNHAVFINATEDEFNSLMDSYVSEIESEGKDFNINFFRNYVLKSGYYCYVEIYTVLPPYAPMK